MLFAVVTAASPCVVRVATATPSTCGGLKARRADHDAVMLEWDAAASDGGAQLTGYMIEKRGARRDSWSYVSKVQPGRQSLQVPGLLTGQQYMFRVRPMNRVGLGKGVEADRPVAVTSQFSE